MQVKVMRKIDFRDSPHLKACENIGITKVGNNTLAFHTDLSNGYRMTQCN